jgi:3-mercaptopyruvate sulfurtransferase SseA
MARLLHEKGYKDVRPLLGGFDAWLELGYPVEREIALAPLPATLPASGSSK